MNKLKKSIRIKNYIANITLTDDVESRRIGKVLVKTSCNPIKPWEMILFPFALRKLAIRMFNNLNGAFQTELITQELHSPVIHVKFKNLGSKKEVKQIIWREDVKNAIIKPVDIDRNFTTTDDIVTKEEGYVFVFEMAKLVEQVTRQIPDRAISYADRKLIADGLTDLLEEYYEEQTVALQSRFA